MKRYLPESNNETVLTPSPLAVSASMDTVELARERGTADGGIVAARQKPETNWVRMEAFIRDETDGLELMLESQHS